MRPNQKFIQIAMLGIFMSNAIIIAVSLAKADMSPILIINGFLMGVSLIIVSTERLLARKNEVIDNLLAMNHALMADNRHMVEINQAMQAALSGAPEMPPEKPMGRVH